MAGKFVAKWDLQNELKTMAVSCIGISEQTAKNKAKKIFDKYDSLMFYSNEEKDRILKKNEQLKMSN